MKIDNRKNKYVVNNENIYFIKSISLSNCSRKKVKFRKKI